MQIKVYFSQNGGRKRVVNGLVPRIEEGLRKICREQHLECYIGRIIGRKMVTITIGAMLEEPVYNTYTYTAGYGVSAEELEIWWSKKYRKWRGLVGNEYYRTKLQRTRFLQWCHWAKLDNAINKLLDSLEVYAVLESAYGVLRSGWEWAWINPCDPRHEYWHNALHRPDIYGYCKDLPSEEELKNKHTREK